MKKTFNTIYILLALVLFGTACKKNDYFVGGDLHNPRVGVSTYDFLKNNDRGLFDTLLMIIDAAGAKEKINQQGITFFAPTDYSINSYIEARTAIEQNIDPFRKWTVDSIIKYELPRFKDSLDIYIIPKKIDYSDLTEKGEVYITQKGNYSLVSYERTDDPNLGYNPNSGYWPQVMYFTYLYAPLEEDMDAAEIPTLLGVRTRVQTSGVVTTTGTINVLNNGHRLFFFR
jgi:hypothetical protein